MDAVRGTMGGNHDLGGSECSGAASYIIMDDGNTCNLYVPSSFQNGLKLVIGFIAPVNGSSDLTDELNLAR